MLRLLCYVVHFRDPSFHSWTVPTIKITINIKLTINHSSFLVSIILVGSGSIIAISTSKIKKIIATMKKCMENGRRALVFGSNPHSKEEDLFSCKFSFFIMVKLMIPISVAINNDKRIIIIFSFYGLIDWKSILLI